jgi:hypothetical protein
MNTIAKTGTAATALLLALLTGVSGSAAGNSSPQPTEECHISPTLVEQWVRAGQPLPPCVREHNLAVRHYADDRRPTR